MNPIYYDCTLNMSSNNNFIQISTVQEDGPEKRYIRAMLINNSVEYTIPPDTEAYIAGTKPDNNAIFNKCTIENNRIIAEITPQMSAVSGRGDYQMMLIDMTDNSQLKTFPFYIVTVGVFDPGAVTSTSEFQALAEALAKAEADYSMVKVYAAVASEKAQEAASSATGAASSASSATIKAGEAETSATNAANSATAAANSAAAAASSAAGIDEKVAEAAQSATNAANSATTAATKASEASTSASNAATSETNAANSASAAATSETNAASSATTASDKATEASTSASDAADSATAAANSATDSADSATASASSASDAADSATLAESWARGDTGIREGENTNNSMFYANNAQNSATASAASASAASTSEDNARNYQVGAQTAKAQSELNKIAAGNSATSAANSAGLANDYSNAALQAKTDAETAQDLARQWVGGTTTDVPSATNNSIYWAQYMESLAQSIGTGLVPRGNIYFADIPVSPNTGWMYAIIDRFTTDSRFEEGAGHLHEEGTMIYYNAQGTWSILLNAIGGGKGTSVIYSDTEPENVMNGEVWIGN